MIQNIYQTPQDTTPEVMAAVVVPLYRSDTSPAAAADAAARGDEVQANARTLPAMAAPAKPIPWTMIVLALAAFLWMRSR